MTGSEPLHPPVSEPEHLPEHEHLTRDLRLLREKGLLRIRELDLPALTAIARRAGAGEQVGPRAVEALLRRAQARLGDDDFGTASGYLFGLVQGTIGVKPTDLRERAAGIFGLSPETFRKERERLIVARMADELLSLAAEPPQSLPQPALPAAAQEVSAQAGEQPEARIGVDPAPAPIVGLPREPVLFTGRDDELSRLMAAFTAAPAAGETVICAVHGMAGVGKTALAVRAARRLAERFPSGTLFVDLHGHTPDRPAEQPGDVLGRLLRRLQVSPERIPPDVEDRAALLAQVLTGRRILLVLDNARDVAQVLPLLPASDGCGVLLTSRHRLTGLDEAEHVPLGVLAREESVELFARVAGIDVSGGGSTLELVDRVAERCADLPLAVRIAAARHRVDPAGGLGGLLARLLDEAGRLAELDDGTRSVAAAFSVSYAQLPDQVQRAFALLGLHPGADLTVAAAAALFGRPVDQARHLLDVLLDRHLLERSENAADRYRFHDLMAVFARGPACAGLIQLDRTTAFRRLTGYFLQAAAQADEVLTPHRHRIELQLTVGTPPSTRLSGYPEAMSWFGAEEANLVAVCRAAGERGFDVVTWQLAYTLRGYFFVAKSWVAWQSTHEAALAATRRLGDQQAEAMTLNNLGVAAIEQGLLKTAAERYQAALSLFEQIGDAHGVHTARANRAWVAFAEHRYQEFLLDMDTAYHYYRRTGAERNAAITLRGMALGEVAVGRPEQAIRQVLESLVVFRELQLPLDVAIALNNLGEACTAAGRIDQALDSHQQAQAAALHCGSVFELARARVRLGDLADRAGDGAAAQRYWSDAADGYELLGAGEAAVLRSRLDDQSPRS